MKHVVGILKKNNAKYSIKKTNRKITVYSVLIKDSKTNRNKKIRRTKKVFVKNKLFYEQFSTTKKKMAKMAIKIFEKKRFYKKNIKLIKKSKKITQYVIRYKRSSPLKSKDNSEVSAEYRLAQSKLRLEYQKSTSGDYYGEYGDLLTGLEVEGEKYSGKIMGRFEFFGQEKLDFEDNKYKKHNIDLGETYLNFELGSGQLTVGRQMFSWGVFDEFSNLDRTNIKNLPRFVFDSGESYRRPISSLRYEYYKNDWKIDAFVDFGLEQGKELDEKSLWTGINRKLGIIRGADTNLLDPSLVKNMKSHFIKRDKAGQGLRVTHSSSGDLSFTYLNAYSDLPTIEFSETLRNQILAESVDSNGLSEGINLMFYQESVFGIDYANTFWGQLFKFEITYTPNSLVIVEDLSLKKLKRSRLSVGGDFEFDFLSTTLTWQVVSEQVLSDEETLLDKNLKQYIFQSSSRLIEDKIELGLKTIYNGNDKSYFLSPFVNYELSDSDTLGLSMHTFFGEEGSFFGYHEEDNLTSLSYQKLF